VIAFLLVRMERSLEAARRLVAEIDKLALAMRRGVTRAIAAQALELVGNHEK
jgi:chromosomal replication initiation ATPase DnaA